MISMEEALPSALPVMANWVIRKTGRTMKRKRIISGDRGIPQRFAGIDEIRLSILCMVGKSPESQRFPS